MAEIYHGFSSVSESSDPLTRRGKPAGCAVGHPLTARSRVEPPTTSLLKGTCVCVMEARVYLG